MKLYPRSTKTREVLTIKYYSLPDIELMIAMWSNHSKARPLCSPQRGGCIHGYDDYNDDDDIDDDDNDDNYNDEKMPSQI